MKPYSLKNKSQKWLEDNEFRYAKHLSKDGDVFIKTFPVWKDGDWVTLECQLSYIADLEKVFIDVLDCNNRCEYLPFYRDDCGPNELIPKIEKQIIQKLTELGATRKETEYAVFNSRRRGKNFEDRKEPGLRSVQARRIPGSKNR